MWNLENFFILKSECINDSILLTFGIVFRDLIIQWEPRPTMWIIAAQQCHGETNTTILPKEGSLTETKEYAVHRQTERVCRRCFWVYWMMEGEG